MKKRSAVPAGQCPHRSEGAADTLFVLFALIADSSRFDFQLNPCVLCAVQVVQQSRNEHAHTDDAGEDHMYNRKDDHGPGMYQCRCRVMLTATREKAGIETRDINAPREVLPVYPQTWTPAAVPLRERFCFRVLDAEHRSTRQALITPGGNGGGIPGETSRWRRGRAC